MEQIYYTQCPIGYGLGASNGFQIKRLTSGYPISGDFRHLNLRAYPGGGRVLAPRTLRYRRDDQTAEVAMLCPRTQEYETERGLWGRPGGHFAHGLRLNIEELASLANWPAGLARANLWTTSDPEPSQGRAPTPITIGTDSLPAPPTLEVASALLGGRSSEFLAGLLAAVAASVHHQRTLFLIGEPDGLADLVAGLTLAFPKPLRRGLTFSTFHDRPEELSGYRIQGTCPSARPNRSVLIHQGFLAELGEGTISPDPETLPWARMLAGAILAADEASASWWQDIESIARRAIGSRDPGAPEFWSPAWLSELYHFPERVRNPQVPVGEEDWGSTIHTLAWVKAGRLGRPWSSRRGFSWFRSAISNAPRSEPVGECLARHLEFAEVWEPAGSAAGWGSIAAQVIASGPAESRDAVVERLLARVPEPARPGFTRALLRDLPSEASDAILERLRGDIRMDRLLLLPLEAVQALQPLWARGDREPLRSIIREAGSRQGLLAAVLDSLEEELRQQPIGMEVVADVVAEELTAEQAGEWLPWMLGQGDPARTWLTPWLRPLLTLPGNWSVWERLRDLLPADLRPSYTRHFLAIASDHRLPPDAFLWGVEGLLIGLPPETRPEDPAWPEAYFQRIASDLDLIDRLYIKRTRVKGLGHWLRTAHQRGELSEHSRSRVAIGKQFVDAIEFGSHQLLSELPLPEVPPAERGRMLRRLAGAFLGRNFEGLSSILSACRRTWPDGFLPGASGLEDIGAVIAEWLAPWSASPAAWQHQLDGILSQLGQPSESGLAWDQDGLAAYALLAALRLAPDRWGLLQSILDAPRRRRALALPMRRELLAEPPLDAPIVFHRWEDRLTKSPPESFYEVFLNACDGPRMAAVIATNPNSVRTLGPMSWWQARSYPEAIDDIRDGFARLAPIRPFPSGTIGLIDGWLHLRGSGPQPVVTDTIGETDGQTSVLPAVLSEVGRRRWRAIQAITRLYQQAVETRESSLDAWRQEDLLIDLSEDELHGFAAWLILAIPHASNDILAEKLGFWFHKQGIHDVQRLGQWWRELDGQFEVEEATVQDRRDFVGVILGELRHRIGESRGR